MWHLWVGVGGDWRLVDQDGRGVSDATYQDGYSLLYFGFTHCPDICPSELGLLHLILSHNLSSSTFQSHLISQYLVNWDSENIKGAG